MADLVAREQVCCSFLSFAIGVSPAAIVIAEPGDGRPGRNDEGSGDERRAEKALVRYALYRSYVL